MIDEIIDKFMFSIYGGIFFLLLSCIAFYYAIVIENKKISCTDLAFCY